LDQLSPFIAFLARQVAPGVAINASCVAILAHCG
jgi:hypothetical protein